MMRKFRVDQVAPFALLMPVVGVAAGALGLGERLTLFSALGGIVVLAGLALALAEPAANGSP